MQLLDSCLVTVAAGLEGDFRGKPGKRQVTVLSRSAWQAACHELGAEIPWESRRANLLVDLPRFGPDDVGKIIRIGELALLITRETDPCHRMDKVQRGLRAALTPDWRGGVCCRVMNDARISIGDKVTLMAPKSFL
jgi:MOSC domain-containing protein YiiM